MSRAAIAVAAGAALASGCARADPDLELASARLKQQLEVERAPRGKQSREALIWKRVRAFYEKTGHRPAWFKGKRPHRNWDKLLAALQSAPRHGLDPGAYDLQGLTALRGTSDKGLLGRESFKPEAVGEIDPRLTRAFLQYATHLAIGKLDPRAIDETWLAKKRDVDTVAALQNALHSGDVQGSLEALAPRHPGYVRLVQAADTVPSEGRRTLELNMERWRWLPEDLGRRHIVVNIPAYELRLYGGGEERLRMRVVVGKRFNPTPVFSDEITYVTFNPTWNVPEKIVAEEILPALEQDDTYLERHQMEVFRDGQKVSVDEVDLYDPKSFQIRQRPGAHNALGGVKFVFPNAFDVYLHDTPSESLFARTERAFSHGCVRVEKPADLAAVLLDDQPKWTRAAIEKAMAPGTEQSVKLTEPVPVHIVYWTMWVEADGAVHRADDVYGHDRTQAAALERLQEPAERRAAR